MKEKKVSGIHLKLSVIIPVYKVEKYLRRCLCSVLNGIKNEEAVEVLIIDDGSPDRSGKIADSCARKYPFVRVIHKENEGVAAARNTGIRLAKGEWLYFVDSDDWLADGAIDILLEKSMGGGDADIILFDAWKNTGRKESAWEHFQKEAVWTEKAVLRRLQRGVLYFQAAGMATKVPLAAPWDKMYRRAFLVEQGIWFQPELKVLDDMIFNMAALGKAEKVAYYKDKIYHYRYVPESITNNYSPDRITLERKVWDYLNSYMLRSFQEDEWEKGDKDRFIQAYYCRIIKSFSICCRLVFFHPQNKRRFRNKIRYVREVLAAEPYQTAFDRVAMKNAEWRLKAVILMGRLRAAGGIYLLHKLQSMAVSCR